MLHHKQVPKKVLVEAQNNTEHVHNTVITRGLDAKPANKPRIKDTGGHLFAHLYRNKRMG